MGNKIRLGSNLSDIDEGPWDKGQEVSLFLASSGLLFIVSAVYKELNENYEDIQSKLEVFVCYYWDILNEKGD